MSVPIHEFWLKNFSDKFQIPYDKNKSNIYRVALGDLIDATERKVYPPNRDSEGTSALDLWNKSGSIGFMDLTIRKEFVPKEGTKPYKRQEYLDADCENVNALIISKIGIEPEYTRKGYARLLKQRAEEIAREWGLVAIVSDQIDNPVMRDFNARLGYTLYDPLKAVKRIKR